MNKHLVFVYGSLKSGFHNHVYLQGATCFGPTRTKSRKYSMVSLGGYPGVRKDGNYAIDGELYVVDDRILANLDRLESNGYLYQREKVLLAEGITAWMYFLILKPREFGPAKDRIKHTRNHTQNWVYKLSRDW